MPPVFLTLDEVLDIHLDQIARDGGTAGIRDVGLCGDSGIGGGGRCTYTTTER